MKVITICPTDDIKPISMPFDYVSIFLAGGCTTKWRDEFIEELKNVQYPKTIVVYTPFCDSSKIKLSDLITWEHDHILQCDILAFNFEGSQSVQPGSLFELGRYCVHRNDPIFINTDLNYKLLRELKIHVDLINKDRNELFANVFDIKVTNSSIKDFVKYVVDNCYVS